MTVPDPTAGERKGPCWRSECRTTCCYPAVCLEPASPPVAASTGTSEDVEALAEVLQRGIFGDEQIMEAVREARRQDARAVLGSGWLAARESAARAQALREAADTLDDHTSCDCEDGDHLRRLATPTWLRNRAAREAR